jgi:hypothetical protein
MWGLAMKRFHCVPETTTFQALNIGDVFQYIGGSSEFVKSTNDRAILEDVSRPTFLESPNKPVVWVGHYRREPERPEPALPCPETPDADAQGESRAECPAPEEVCCDPMSEGCWTKGPDPYACSHYS